MPLSGSATHHQRARNHESWPQAANEICQPAELRTDADQQILIENKERLDRTNFAGLIADNEISVIEFVVDRILDQFVISAILRLRAESMGPAFAFFRLASRGHLHARQGDSVLFEKIGNMV